MRRVWFALAGCFAASMLMSLTDDLLAQSIWLDKRPEPGVFVEFLKPSFEGNPDISFWTAAWFFTGRVPMSRTVVFTGEAPISHIGFDGTAETTLGNLYVGLEFFVTEDDMLEVGIRLPAVLGNTEAAAGTGFFGDFDRFEAFLPDMLSIPFRWNYSMQAENKILFRSRLGTTLMVMTVGEADPELYLDYSVLTGYGHERFEILGGLTGRLLATQGNLSASERTVHHLGIGGNVVFGPTRPGLRFSLPIDDDLNDLLDYTLVLNVAIALGD